jgi:hypothetical protein
MRSRHSLRATVSPDLASSTALRRKGRPITLSLPFMSTPADVTAALSAIVSQMAEGEITPEEAAVAASVIETKRKALETEELDRRMTSIEQQLAKEK